MAIKIKFDSTNNVRPPTLVLATRKGRKLGAIPACDVKFREGVNTYSELTFKVYKRNDGIEYSLWNKLKDFKLVYCRDWDIWFEINVEINESNELIKNVSAKSLGESELSQINLYDVEINTENDILREDYIPTVLFDEDNPNASLLNRIMEKVPHYRIAHVDTSIANIQRTFTFDSTSIYDAFQEISKEINCVFEIGSGSDSNGQIDRAIRVYDLESYCLDCGNREEFISACPKCGSTNFLSGYGEDTTIFISADNLADDITYSTDSGSVKNCFKLTAGDDLMTATLMNCNPNGSGYIWYISDEVKEDMSAELVSKLNEYDKQYNYYQKEHQIIIDTNLLTRYNELVDKYFKYSDKLEKIPSNVKGYPVLMNMYYNTIDFELFLTNGLMPNVELQGTTAVAEAAKLNRGNLSPVAVVDIEKCSEATASSAVLAVAKTIVDSRYQVKVKDSSLNGLTWTGNFTVTNYSDEEDTALSTSITIDINDNYEEYVKQKLEKALSKSSDEVTDIVSLFKLSVENFEEEIKKYSLSRLIGFQDSCQACLDILIEQGVADRETWEKEETDLYTDLYTPYYNKLSLLQEEIKVRESEIAIVVGAFDANNELLENGLQTIIEHERNQIQEILNFEKFIGEELWLEFVAYRREDTYQNDNYISDGLNNAELFENALEFIEIAKKDIYKSATLQHSITATLKNLLIMKEFTVIVDHFKVGNWIRVRVDNAVYRLRLLDYEIDFNNLDNLPITFSDVMTVANGISDIKSILDKSASMASSYGSVSRQAGQGKKSSEQLNDWVDKGLALTKMKIVDNANNQNITWDSHGLLCKEYLPITDNYDDRQLKIINRGLYLTDDNWLTSRAGIGNFTFYNPETSKMEESYGVIADTLIGNLVLSEKVGIYNVNNSIVMGENGVIITADNTINNANQMAFTIQKKTLDSNGNTVITPSMYIDSEGNLVLTGTIKINSTTDNTISTLDDLADINRLSEKINEVVHSEGQIIYSSIDAKYSSIIRETTSQLEAYKADIGQYMQFNENGLTLGATSSEFKTVIDNNGMYFKQGNTIAAYINKEQLYIPTGIIETNLIVGNFYISPREDGGMSITWQGD